MPDRNRHQNVHLFSREKRCIISIKVILKIYTIFRKSTILFKFWKLRNTSISINNLIYSNINKTVWNENMCVYACVCIWISTEAQGNKQITTQYIQNYHPTLPTHPIPTPPPVKNILPPPRKKKHTLPPHFPPCTYSNTSCKDKRTENKKDRE